MVLAYLATTEASEPKRVFANPNVAFQPSIAFVRHIATRQPKAPGRAELTHTSVLTAPEPAGHNRTRTQLAGLADDEWQEMG